MSPMVTFVSAVIEEGVGIMTIFNKSDLAVDYLQRGYMCSESIVLAFADDFKFCRETAAKISGGFGGGMAQGKICGAVTGAVMVIGLKYGAGFKRCQYSKELCFFVTQEFSHRFISRRKTLECNEILLMNNVDFKNPDEMIKLREKKICINVVKDAVEILEELLSEEH